MPADDHKIIFFRTSLMDWTENNQRALPWVGIKNPYHIWLSEIILQQTRVEQGLPYFQKFVTRFPKVADLALANEDEVMKLWEGLGYYSRARNMHAAAKVIHEKFQGNFPNKYKDILALKGVGTYTAAAIASFAYNLPYAVVDGNVLRVLSRFFGIEQAIDTSASKKLLSRLAQTLLDKSLPGAYNQAIMDFGATQCAPRKPKCQHCVMQNKCVAFQKGIVEQLPFKSKKIVKKRRFFNYLVLMQGTNTFLCKRTEKDIWQNLYQFPLIETDITIQNPEELFNTPFWIANFGEKALPSPKSIKSYKQTLTHQIITAKFWEISLSDGFQANTRSCFKHEMKNLSNFAFPKVIDWYLQDNWLFLNP